MTGIQFLGGPFLACLIFWSLREPFNIQYYVAEQEGWGDFSLKRGGGGGRGPASYLSYCVSFIFLTLDLKQRTDEEGN